MSQAEADWILKAMIVMAAADARRAFLDRALAVDLGRQRVAPAPAEADNDEQQHCVDDHEDDGREPEEQDGDRLLLRQACHQPAIRLGSQRQADDYPAQAEE